MNDKKDAERLGGWLDGASERPTDLRILTDSDTANELFAHGVLVGLLEPSEKREQRVQDLLNQFESGVEIVDVGKVPGSRRRWITSLMVAAILIVGVGLWVSFSPSSAEASIDRLIRSTRSPVTRVYGVQIHSRRFGRDSIRECQLFSRGTKKVATVFSDAIRSPAVIGFDGERRWMVAGRQVWTSDNEDRSSLDRFRDRLIDLVTAGNMEIHSLLNKIPTSYDVRLLPAEPLPGNEAIGCRPIEATLKVPSDRLPQRIVIWSHPTTGVAHKMDVQGNDKKTRGASALEFILEGEREVPEDFFTPQYHRVANDDGEGVDQGR